MGKFGHAIVSSGLTVISGEFLGWFFYFMKTSGSPWVGDLEIGIRYYYIPLIDFIQGAGRKSEHIIRAIGALKNNI